MTSWMESVESLLVAHNMIEKLLKDPRVKQMAIESQWQVDQVLLKQATPFHWNAETIDAVLAASRSIPLDTPINMWNLNTPAVWWYFDKPLPFRTIDRKSAHTQVAQYPDKVITEFSKETKKKPEPYSHSLDSGVRALNLGWFKTQPKSIKIPKGSPVNLFDQILRDGIPPKDEMGISAWLDDPLKDLKIIPSQTCLWEDGDTLGEMLAKTRAHHHASYGPGGKWEHEPQIGIEAFMIASEGLARFILAALAWLDQKVIVETSEHIERHRRKDFNKRTGQKLESIRVIQLRRSARSFENKAEGEAGTTCAEWSCRWTVDGHWRNQVCGPKRGDRKLTWINPYVKGPEDKPLRIPERKVYLVNR